MFSSRFKRVAVLSSAGLTIIGGGVLLKDALGGPNFHENVDLNGKVAIVTGANSGIGAQVALGLATRGAKVIMACRDRERCEKARETVVVGSQNKYVYCRYCDLSSQDSIMRFARRINNEMKTVDILVNNAGVMACPRELTKEGIEMQMGVNHMGHFLLTNLILDKLKSGAPSRIINLTSIAYKRGKLNVEDLNSEKSYSPDMAYNQSCLANALFTRELAKKLEGTGVTVNAVNPGITDTNLMRHKNASWYLTKWVTYPFVWPFVKSARQGAQVVLHTALSESLNDVSGKLIGLPGLLLLQDCTLNMNHPVYYLGWQTEVSEDGVLAPYVIKKWQVAGKAVVGNSQYVSGRKVEEFSDEALRDDLARWLWLVDEKWTKLDKNLVQSKLQYKKKSNPVQKTTSEETAKEKTVVTTEEKKQNTSITVISDGSAPTTNFTNPLSNVTA